MWRSTTFRAFARWGLCQRHKPKPQPPAPEGNHAARSLQIAPVTGFGAKDRKRSSSEKETFDGGQFFAHTPEVSLLETVGWVGTVLTVGLNFRLHSRRNDAEASLPPDHRACVSSPFTICSLVHRFLLQFALASPLFPRSDASKSVLPRGSSSSQGVAESADSAAASSAKTSPPASSNDLERLARECIGQIENFKGAQLISSDARRAVKHFERAQVLGTCSAHYNLGVCYEKGIGVAKDLYKAARHYEWAALKGHAKATYNLGVFYLEGLGGLNPNPDMGLELIKKASLLGVPQAKTYIGQQYLHQCIWEEAVSLFKDAAQENDPDASYFLGVCYANGLGVRQDSEAAARHYERAASAGDEQAAVALRDLNVKRRRDTESIVSIAPEVVVTSADKHQSPVKTESASSRNHRQLRHSSSSPELSQRGTPENVGKHRANVSQYLDLDVFLRQKHTFGISDREDFLPIPNDVSRVACQELCVV